MANSWRDPALIAALQLMFRSKEGPALAEICRRKIAEIGPSENSALQRHEGERSFAADLLRVADGRAGAFKTDEEATATGGRVPGRRLPKDLVDETGEPS